MNEPRLLLFARHARDERGAFSCVWSAPSAPFQIVEEYQSYSVRPGTLRGLHWQEPQQAKLVRVISGAILDVCVRVSDLTTWGFSLSADRPEWLYVPEGHAHGFCTLVPETLVLYHASSIYAPHGESRLNPFDPKLAIEWPVTAENAIMSDKDRNSPFT